MKPTDIFRYLTVIGILIVLFFLNNLDKVDITQKEINLNIEKKIPIIKKQKIIETTITKVVTSLSDNSDEMIHVNIDMNVEYSDTKTAKVLNTITSLFVKKEKSVESEKKYNFNINLDTTPFIKDNKIFLKIENMNFEKDILNSHAKLIEKYLQKLLIHKSIYNLDKLKSSKYLKLKGIKINTNEGNYVINANFEISFFIYFVSFILIISLMLREIGILAIRFYRKFLSKRKSYTCAKGHETGETCSSTVLKEFKRKGFYAGMTSYFKSIKECKQHYKNIKERDSQNSGTRGGDCNNGCDPSYACIGIDAHAMTSGAKSCDGPCDCSGCDIGSC